MDKLGPPGLPAIIITLIAFTSGLYIEWLGWRMTLENGNKRGFFIIGFGFSLAAAAFCGVLFGGWWNWIGFAL